MVLVQPSLGIVVLDAVVAHVCPPVSILVVLSRYPPEEYANALVLNLLHSLRQTQPQLLVRHWLLRGSLPAVELPLLDVVGNAFEDVLRVCLDYESAHASSVVGEIL